MKKALLIFCIFFCISVYAEKDAYAQNEERVIDKWEKEMLKNLPKKGWFYKSLKHDYYGGAANIHMGWTILLFKDVTYHFISRTTDNCYKKDALFSVYDENREYVFSYNRYYGSINKSFDGIYFKCKATGFYYLSLDYSYCKTIVLIGMKH